MKHFYKLGLCMIGMALVAACEHEPLEFNVDKPVHFAAQEEIDAYEDLKTYLDRQAAGEFRLGTGIALSNYLSKGVMYRLVNRNFDEITPWNEMTHQAVVQENGRLNIANLIQLVSVAKDAQTTIYGQPLTWHLNQNATYLRGLLSPLIVESPAFVNSLPLTGLTSGTLQGWDHSGGVSIVENDGMGGGKAVKLVSGAASSQPADLQLVTPEIPVVPGSDYEVICYIKSDAPGEGRISFEGLNNNTPVVDWMKTGQATETFTTGIGWREIKFKINGFQGDKIRLKFDLGYAPHVTYHLDVKNMYVYNTKGDRIENNLIPVGDFETGVSFGGWGNNSTRGITEAGQGVQGGRAFYVTNPSKTANYWDVQTLYELPGGALQNGKLYNLSFWVKGTAPGTIRPEMQSANYSSNGFGAVSVTTEWTKVELATTINAADRNRFVISYGELAGTVYIDKVMLTMDGATSGGETTVVERTQEEKKGIINGQMERWISGMVKAMSTAVKAWDVVKDPMDDSKPLELRSGIGKTLGDNEFYWQDYLGKDYAVEAFKLAREHGNSSDLLFISDHNLESNLEKCRGLIQYVTYLESKGAKVDGISTQMHINLYTDKENIATMFGLLAATGKMIKVSELDVALDIDTNLATPEHFAAQKEMYKYVVDKYMELIPANKRYGITTWTPVNDGSGLWATSNYTRKPSYAGFADALKSK
ncbi:endo-1,4-beta-xylanase [Pontibacter sp. SGAir0037]|uniref:endo-1,4-beta-xylanase n=1 Tax=Pontibacter sp. SGAir0037 TaxID=2571030 RepID=UPI0010CCF67A|nr:endo-1,4-beta-xylanase [Pontibacter sp. SGAir0037]QCR24970.1 1,4-beta-xylanase [Pontibacter sp. SGAir0037]